MREPVAFGPWILGITVHRAHRHFRRRKLLRAIGAGRTDDPVTLDELATEGTDAAMTAPCPVKARGRRQDRAVPVATTA